MRTLPSRSAGDCAGVCADALEGRFAGAAFAGAPFCAAGLADFAVVFRGRGLDFISSISISLVARVQSRAALARASLRIPWKL
jgi:hypothetical protein